MYSFQSLYWVWHCCILFLWFRYQNADMVGLLAQFIKSTGVIIATGYMWALVPEVISYGEYTHGKRISGIVNALTGIFYKAEWLLEELYRDLLWLLSDSTRQMKCHNHLCRTGNTVARSRYSGVVAFGRYVHYF